MSSLKSLRVMAMLTFALSLCAVWTLPAAADPPPWAPAHGYRAKHKDKHKHKRKKSYDYGHYGTYVPPIDLRLGHCEHDRLGVLLGGAAGAAVGTQIGGGSGRTAAIIGGTILGALIGGSIGRHMDSIDQHCVGQALEHANDGQNITWRNPESGTQYRVAPTRTVQVSDGRYCREYTTEALIGGRVQQTYGTACRQPDGSWQIQR
jgi:surface antigen